MCSLYAVYSVEVNFQSNVEDLRNAVALVDSTPHSVSVSPTLSEFWDVND
jgi:hypothetical protein